MLIGRSLDKIVDICSDRIAVQCEASDSQYLSAMDNGKHEIVPGPPGADAFWLSAYPGSTQVEARQK